MLTVTNVISLIIGAYFGIVLFNVLGFIFMALLRAVSPDPEFSEGGSYEVGEPSDFKSDIKRARDVNQRFQDAIAEINKKYPQ